jgi:uncharacterized NAD-dependent epimerase/dehydratase family protein
VIRPDQRLAFYMEGSILDRTGKMGFGLLRYSPNHIVCVIDSQTAGGDAAEFTGSSRPLPIVATIDEALALGSDVLVLGIAPPGGLIPPDWYPMIDLAVQRGMSVVNGLHDVLGPRYPTLAEGQFVWDIRVEPQGIGVGYGKASALDNIRILMIGTDMSCGKMTAGLELQKSLIKRGVRASFVATGQIGMSITGSGIPLDAVRIDFASGAVEREVLARRDDDVVIIEGQGALIHPGSSANLPLLRGAMPTHLVLCHRAGATSLQRLPDVKIPPLGDYIRLYEELGSACGTFPRPSTIGVALNTSILGPDSEASDACRELSSDLGLPVTDAVRFGMDPIADAVMH